MTILWVMSLFLLGSALGCQAADASYVKAAARLDLVPGVVINHVPAASGLFVGSPSIAILPGGDYVTSHDFFGPKSTEHKKARSAIFRSSDHGQSWKKTAEIEGAFWSTLFVHRGALYLLGTD